MAFTRVIGGSSLDDNIRVVGVNPGPVDTDRIYSMPQKRAGDVLGEALQGARGDLSSRRPAHPREVTDLMVFLASFRSGYTSGTIFTVDGRIASRRSIV
jgi:NAD(P)-dependent dehydrogenase (short-subunit alcohol dehydrogenase family)